MRKQEPGAPLGRVRQVLPGCVDKRSIPHEFVVLVGCRERDRDDRHDQEGGKPGYAGVRSRVLTETDVGNDRHERGPDEMACAPDREHQERTGKKFNRATDNPECNDDEQHADWHAANLALGRNQPQTEQRIAGCAEDQ